MTEKAAAAAATGDVAARALGRTTADAEVRDPAHAIVGIAIDEAADLVGPPTVAVAGDPARPCPTGSGTREIAKPRPKAPVSVSSISPTILEKRISRRFSDVTDRWPARTSFTIAPPEGAADSLLFISSTWMTQKRPENVVLEWRLTGGGSELIFPSRRGHTRQLRESTWGEAWDGTVN